MGPALIVLATPSTPDIDPQTRGRWILAVLAVLILGVSWIVLVWLAGRMTRRWMGSGEAFGPSPFSEFGSTEWARRRRRSTSALPTGSEQDESTGSGS